MSQTDLARPPAEAVRRRRGGGQRTVRLLHLWTSMGSLLIVLFFAVTGLLANNPSWTFGQQPQVTSVGGQLPQGAVVDGVPNYLVISEYLRANQGASGQISDYGLSGDSGRISYGAPGYTATASFSLSQGTFVLQTTRSGLAALLTDLHKGTNAALPWKLAIDAAAILLGVVAVTGLVMQLMMAKKRTTAMVLIGVGVVVGLGLMFLA